ncbi:MAG: diacylglycerol kinase family lipid kinase [Deltaproteobacteria bacterium]|nr:diacylglycerol kinase family lipid kinase [Deltaproteobacteria bacterium]
MKVRFIINPAAGGRKKAAAVSEAASRLLKSEEGVFEVKVTKARGDGRALSAEAVRKGYDIVFACGGDGTVNEVATPLVGTETALGIIPAGSGNALARSLGIPEGIDQAIGLIKGSRFRKIDAGVICGRHFFSTAGAGFDAFLSKKYNEGYVCRRLRGLLPYFPLAAFEYLRYRPVPMTVKSGGLVRDVAPFILTAANTERYGGGAVIAPGASLDDGLLDLCIITDMNILRAAGLAFKLFSGKADRSRGFTRIMTDRVGIEACGPIIAHADGEPFEWRGDISIEALPGALKVLVP